MYGKGGWVFVPDHALPIRKLTTAQKRENAAAERQWRETRDKILRIAAEASAEAEKLGGYIPHGDDDDGPSFPEFTLPHPEHQYDVDNFTATDRAVYEYRETGRWEDQKPETLRRLHAMVKAGVKTAVAFHGMSVGSFPPSEADFRRDGPAVPDFLNDNWSKQWR